MLPTERPDQADAQQWQLASIVVYCRPEHLLSAREALQCHRGAELHADDGAAKLVLTLEAESSRQLAETMDAMRLVNGVMSLQMVYHQLDDDAPSLTSPQEAASLTPKPIIPELIKHSQEAS